ncbi:MAG: hypothetical protein ACYS8K_07765 [Planctomycetota bacterium]|jgi:hypothetical protein
MRVKLVPAGVAAAACLAAGCVAPNPQQRQAAEAGRARAAALLASFAAAVGQKDSDGLPPLLDPLMSQREVRRRYSLEVESALEGLSWRDWQEDELEIRVEGSNAAREELEDEFQLVRTEGEWYVWDFTLAEPERGERLDPPPDVVAEILPRVRQIVELLKEGSAGPLLYQLPDDPSSKYRMPKLSWWEKLKFGKSVPPIHLSTDMAVLQRFSFGRWPDPEEDLYFVHASSSTITAVYEVPYLWPAGGVSETDILRVEMTFLQEEQGWSLFRLRFVGEGILYSQ